MNVRPSAGRQNWSELIVDDNLFHGEYISMPPGAKTPPRFHQDNRAFWIVQDGQIRFTIEGQEPFVATKGFLVQVTLFLNKRAPADSRRASEDEFLVYQRRPRIGARA